MNLKQSVSAAAVAACIVLNPIASAFAVEVSPLQAPLLEGNFLTPVANTCLAVKSLSCRSVARSNRLRCVKSGRSTPKCNVFYFRALSRCIADCMPGPSGLQSN